MIESASKECLLKLQTCQFLKDKGIIAEKPAKKLPCIMMYDIEKYDTNQEALNEIYTQNLVNLTPKEQFLTEF